MAEGYVVRENRYFDSVFLMQIARRISDETKADEVAALMGTPSNKVLLAEIDFQDPVVQSASPNDLVIALRAKNQNEVDEILADIDQWLARPPRVAGRRAAQTLNQALKDQPQTNLVVISVPGVYAAKEADSALDDGRNVFLFSNNVSVEDELRLKQRAQQNGLVVMGPDCGTAIIAGVGIGFANVVRRGPIGAIGVAGTGLQEFTSLVHQYGSGVSQAIGTGGRDLSDEVGGITALRGLELLESDPNTEVIALISKPPGESTLSRLNQVMLDSSKPIMACVLGLEKGRLKAGGMLHIARTVEEASLKAVEVMGVDPGEDQKTGSEEIRSQIKEEQAKFAQSQRYIRGVFAGGTFCYQAQQVLGDLGLTTFSNAPLPGMLRLDNPRQSQEHTCVDMGDDQFTQSRPHPMIDASLRNERMLDEAADPKVAVLLLDFVLGYNASSDPVGDMLAAIEDSKSIAEKNGRHLAVVASVCGTDEDPQDRRSQIQKLEGANVIVARSSAQAAEFAVMFVEELGE